jgi:hypothetical protein
VSSDPEQHEAMLAETPAEVIEEVVAELEQDVVHPAPASDDMPHAFTDLTDSFGQEQVEEMVLAIDSAFGERQAFETAKNPDNANIHRTLKKAREYMTRSSWAARVMLATNMDPQVINRTIHDGSCYNVYAIGKLADVIGAVGTGIVQNAINNACMRSLFKFRAAGLVFTGELAKAVASTRSAWFCRRKT